MPRPLSGRSLTEGLVTVLPSTVLACRGGSSGASEQPQRCLGKITVMQWDPPTTPFGEWLRSYFEAFPRGIVTDPPAVEALDFFQKLIHVYQVAPPPGTVLGGGNPFAAERVAMLRAPAALLNVVHGQNPQLEFDVTLFPRGRAGYVAYGGGGGYVMLATTKYPDAAWELLKYIGDREYAVNKVKTGALGPRISTAREFFVQPDKPPQHAPLYFEAHAHAGREPNITNWIDVQNAVAEEFNQLLANRGSAMETAQAMKQRVEALLPQGEPFI